MKDKAKLKMKYDPDTGKIAVILDFASALNRKNIRHLVPPEQLAQDFAGAMKEAGYDVTFTPRDAWRKDLEKTLQELTKFRDALLRLEERDAAAARLARAQARQDEAEDFLTAAQACHARLDQASADYAGRVRPFVEAFTQLMPDLACFAGCRTEKDTGTLSASLSNRRGHICRWLSAYQNRLRAEDLPEFPDLTVPEPPVFAEEHETVPDRDPDLLTRLNGVLEELEQVRKSRTAPEPETLSEAEQLLEHCRAVPRLEGYRYGQTVSETNRLKKEADGLECAARRCMEQAGPYCSDSRKMAAYLRQREKEWDYVRLLQRARPVLEEIARRTDQEMDDGWFLDLCQQLRALAEEPVFRTVRFCWVDPDSELCRNSESIQVDFRAGEASWPGLYCRPQDGGRLICIVPGSVAADAAFREEAPKCGN